MALLSALAGAFIALMGARWLTRPLEQLLASVNRVTQGDLSHQADVAEIREFQTLASAFNSMTAAVQDREKQLAEALVEVETALEAEEQANRLKSEFMANVSHELRTPLNAMLNVPVVVLADLPEIPTWCCSHCNEEYADVLPGAEHDADPYEEDAEANTLQGSDGAQAEVDHPGYAASHEPKPCPDCNAPMSASSRVEFVGDPTELRLLQTDALHAGRHLLNVITDILDFSRLEAGRVELALEDGVQVASVLRDLQATVGALGSDKNVCMETTAISPEIAMRTDRVKLSQILLNLVSNAMKFSPEGAKVLVCAKPAELKGQPAVEFSVEDFGEGIPEEAQALIFERFRQVDSGHTRRRGGTGLGLAITKSLVDLLDGTISVRSSVDTGSAFYVVLPLAGPAEALEDAASEPTGRSGAPALPDHARRVVVVDDDPRQLGIMGKALRQSGFEVELHSDSDAALAALQTSTPDAVVLDIMMPHVCGLTLLRILKEREESKEVPVVVTSAYHNNRDIVRRLGGVWLPKPWNTNHFVRTLTTQLKRNKLHDARAQKQHVGRGET
jgi:signal transduction histidine kinase/ActR/RegA family two-component response regulator